VEGSVQKLNVRKRLGGGKKETKKGFPVLKVAGTSASQKDVGENE